jgi:hypothetical protein
MNRIGISLNYSLNYEAANNSQLAAKNTRIDEISRRNYTPLVFAGEMAERLKATVC